MKYIITITFLLLSISVFAAPSQQLQWDEVKGATGYYIEIRDSQKNIIVHENIKDNYYSVSNMAPGIYSFRIASLNAVNQRGNSTKWIEFSIEKRYVPDLKSISQNEIYTTDKSEQIVITGSNFKPNSKFMLKGNGKEIQLSGVELKSENEAVLNINPSSLAIGNYDLVIINRGDAESVLKDAISVQQTGKRKEPAKARGPHFVGAGYSLNMPVGWFSEHLALSYIGFDLYFQTSAQSYGFNNIRAEVDIEAARFSSKASVKKASLTHAVITFGLSYFYLFEPSNIELFCKINAGPAYSILALDENTVNKKVTSIDPFAKEAVGLRFYINKSSFIEPELNFKTIFYKGTYFNSTGISLRGGFKF